MQSEEHFLFVDLIMLSSFVTPCIFSLLYRFQEVLSSQKETEETPRGQVSKYQCWQMGKTTFSYLSTLIVADGFRKRGNGRRRKGSALTGTRSTKAAAFPERKAGPETKQRGRTGEALSC